MLLVVVLAMIVALTVGLSVVSRTITNLRISRQNEESQRAFKAAEAGIEQALQPTGGVQDTQGFSNNAGYDITIMNPEGASFLLNGGELVDQSTGADLWLSKYPDFTDPVSANVTIYWSTVDQNDCGNTNEKSVSALEVAMLSGPVENPLLTKSVFDSCARIDGAINAPNGSFSVEGVYFNYAATIEVSSGLIMRIIPVYNSTKIGIKSANDVGEDVPLPPQGTMIESVGESGETVRKVQYYSSHPLIPFEIFPYSLISQ